MSSHLDLERLGWALGVWGVEGVSLNQSFLYATQLNRVRLQTDKSGTVGGRLARLWLTGAT
jgi:hypothetical protein